MLNYNIKNQRGAMPAWAGIIVIIIALAITTWLVISNSSETQPVPAANQTSSTQSDKTVFTYVGIIQYIGESELQLIVSADRNNLNSDRLVTVTYDDQTTITSYSIPKTIPIDITDEQRQNLFKIEIIPSSTLKIDDDITVTADADISNLDRFQATSIKVRTVIDN